MNIKTLTCAKITPTQKRISRKKDLKWIVNHYGMSRIPNQQFGGRGGDGTCLEKLGPILANKMLTEGNIFQWKNRFFRFFFQLEKKIPWKIHGNGKAMEKRWKKDGK